MRYKRTPPLPAVACACEVCGAQFTVWPSIVRRGGGRFCSVACRDHAARTRVERSCVLCGEEFVTRPSRILSGRGNYCSTDCYRTAKRGSTWYGRSEIDRFWSKVDKTSSPHGCWLWAGTLNGAGYGLFHVGGEYGPKIRSHRYSFEAVIGPISAGMEVCHNCPGGDNPRCVNPTHLWIGTHQENMADARQKGRLVLPQERRH
jgi:hypothetical protein